MSLFKIYIDTSVFSAYFDIKKPVRQVETVNWFSMDAKNFEIFISDLVVTEISNTKDSNLKQKLRDLLQIVNPVNLEINDDIINLADLYRQSVIPRELNDSIHIATATYHKMNAIASWNFKHIVNIQTITAIHKINVENLFPIVEILSIDNLGGHQYGNV